MAESGDPKLPLKKLKKVSFDTKVHRVNFARKSTLPIQQRRVSTKFAQHMLLKLAKVDITGYKLPEDTDSDSGGGECARMIPVEGILSCSRTNPVNLDGRCSSTSTQSVQDTLTHQVSSTKRLHVKKRKRLDQRSESQVPSLLVAKPPCKKSKPMKETCVDTQTKKHDNTLPVEKEGSLTAPEPIANSPDEIEYALKLNETIEKITGYKKVIQKKKKKRKRLKDRVVTFPLSNIQKPATQQSKICSLDVKTTSVAVSKGVQADSGFIVDREVMDSYVDVKVNEALYDMKEVLHNIEEQFARVVKEKEKMETVLKDKVQMIRELTVKDYKPECAHKSVATDGVIGPIVANPKPDPKPKKPRRHQRHVGTQTTEEDHSCLQSMVATSLAPYLQLRSSSPILSDYESDGETENTDKIEWMFQNSRSSARCQAIRPQVRLLRVLKENLAKYRPLHYASKYKDILPDAVGWDSLGPELQNIFIVIFKLCHILEMLPLEPVLTDCRQSVVRSLTHLLSHLPFPSSVAQTVNMVEMNRPQTKAMAAYLFGWKVKEIIHLLRSAYRSEFSDILPDYFKAELCRADKISYDNLKFALQGIRNTAMPHVPSRKDTDFVSSSTSETVPPAAPGPASTGVFDWYGLEDEELTSSSDSDSSSSDVEPPNQVGISKRASTDSKNQALHNSEDKNTRSDAASHVGEGIDCSHLVLRKKSMEAAPSRDHRLNTLASKQGSSSHSQAASPSRVEDALQDLSMSQLVAMSRMVQSRIAKIQLDSSEPCLIPRAVSRLMSQNSTPRPSTPNPSSFHINVSSSGNIQGGKVLCNTVSSPAYSPAISGKSSTTTGKSLHQNVAELVSRRQNRVRVQPLKAEESSLRDTTKFSSMKQRWKLSSTGLPVWQPVPTASTTVNQVSAARQLSATSQAPVTGDSRVINRDLQPPACASIDQQASANRKTTTSVQELKLQANQYSSVLSSAAAAAVPGQPSKLQPLKPAGITAFANDNANSMVASTPSAQLNLPPGPAKVVSKAPATTTTSDKPRTNSTQKAQGSSSKSVNSTQAHGSSSVQARPTNSKQAHCSSSVQAQPTNTTPAYSSSSVQARPTNSTQAHGSSSMPSSTTQMQVPPTPASITAGEHVAHIAQVHSYATKSISITPISVCFCQPLKANSISGVYLNSLQHVVNDLPGVSYTASSLPAHSGVSRTANSVHGVTHTASTTPANPSAVSTVPARPGPSAVSTVSACPGPSAVSTVPTRPGPSAVSTVLTRPVPTRLGPSAVSTVSARPGPSAVSTVPTRPGPSAVSTVSARPGPSAVSTVPARLGPSAARTVSAHPGPDTASSVPARPDISRIASSSATNTLPAYPGASHATNTSSAHSCESHATNTSPAGGSHTAKDSSDLHAASTEPTHRGNSLSARTEPVHPAAGDLLTVEEHSSDLHAASTEPELPHCGDLCAANCCAPEKYCDSCSLACPSLTSQVQRYSTDLLKKFALSKPSIIEATRETDTVLIKWTFPGDIESHVSRYHVYYSCKTAEDGARMRWKKIGCVMPLPLPMCVTLANNHNPCTFSIQAVFDNGSRTRSLKSKPLTL